MSLIVFNVLILAANLAYITDNIDLPQRNFIGTMAGIGFIYLVMSSIFRVFGEYAQIRPKQILTSSKDKDIAEKITHMLENDKCYNDVGFNRTKLADELRLTEQHVSKIINGYFGKSFTDLVNNYRLDDAKELLLRTKDPITDIAFNVGFNSITSFNRVFKNNTGVSPRDFRKIEG